MPGSASLSSTNHYANLNANNNNNNNNNSSSSSSKILPNSSRNMANAKNLTYSKNHLNQADLSELLEKFNLTSLNKTNKATNDSTATVGNARHANNLISGEIGANVAASNRSRSLQRDVANTMSVQQSSDDQNLDSHYLDLNSLKQQQQQQSMRKKQQIVDAKPSSASSTSTTSSNNNYSAYNNVGSSANKYSDEIAIILNQNNNSQQQQQSHVVPKPPPGNPQRTTNLYPAR